jgi:hypothetical protein
VVSGALPLTDAVAALTHQPFLFVLERDRVKGMVTRADLQRLPVSMVALGLIIAAEAALDMLIATFTNMEWVSLLTPKRQELIRGVFDDWMARDEAAWWARIRSGTGSASVPVDERRDSSRHRCGRVGNARSSGVRRTRSALTASRAPARHEPSCYGYAIAGRMRG